MENKISLKILILMLVFLVFYSISTYAVQYNENDDFETTNVQEINNVSNESNLEQATGDVTDENWTDFSSAKVNAEKTSEVRKYLLSVSNVIPKSNHIYYYAIGDGTSTPEFSNNLNQIRYDSSKKALYSSAEISSYLELGKDQYVYIYESFLNSNYENLNKLVLEKIKLNKPEQKKYTDAFYATFISKISSNSNHNVQILFNTPWGDNTKRKIHIRVGKISNDNILKDIYDKKSNAFENLLNYSKTSTALFDNVLESNTGTSTAAGGISINAPGNFFDANNILKDDYYFLYAVLEDENGKYVKTEGVTFARASKNTSDNNNYSLFFYGSDNFTWKKFDADKTNTNNSINSNTNVAKNNTIAKDNTVAPNKIPKTGVSAMIIFYIGIALCFLSYSYRKYKKNIY